MLDYVADTKTFTNAAFALRAIQGLACAAFFTTCKTIDVIAYSMFGMVFRGKTLTAANSGFKATIGLGNIVGLFFGAFIYMVGGYKLPFLVYGLLFIVMAPVTCLVLPSSVKKQSKPAHQAVPQESEVASDDLENLQEDASEETHRVPQKIRISDISEEIDPANLKILSVWKIISNKTILKLLFLAIFDMTMLNFSPAIMSNRLTEMRVPPHLKPVFFALPFIYPIPSGYIFLKY